MSGPKGRRERSGPGHGVRGNRGRPSSPLVQIRVIRLVHYFRTTHIIHICTYLASAPQTTTITKTAPSPHKSVPAFHSHDSREKIHTLHHNRWGHTEQEFPVKIPQPLTGASPRPQSPHTPIWQQIKRRTWWWGPIVRGWEVTPIEHILWGML